MARSGGLTLKQSRVVEGYSTDGNGAQAALRAGYSRKTTKAIASKLLTKPDVCAALRTRQHDAAQRAGMTHERIMRELAGLAFTRIDDVATWKGGHLTVKDLAALTPEGTAAIVEISEHETPFTRTLRVKLYSKQAVLKSLLKCLQALDLEERVKTLEDMLPQRRNGYGLRDA